MSNLFESRPTAAVALTLSQRIVHFEKLTLPIVVPKHLGRLTKSTGLTLGNQSIQRRIPGVSALDSTPYDQEQLPRLTYHRASGLC